MLKTFEFLLSFFIALLPVMDVPQHPLLGKKVQYSDLIFLPLLIVCIVLLAKKIITARFNTLIFLILTYVAALGLSGINAQNLTRFSLDFAGTAYLGTLFMLIFWAVSSDQNGRLTVAIARGWKWGFLIVCLGIIAGFIDGYILKKESLFLISYPAEGRYQLIHRMMPRVVSTLRSPDMLLTYLIASCVFFPLWLKENRVLALTGASVGLAGAFLSNSRGIVGLLATVFILTFLLRNSKAVWVWRFIIFSFSAALLVIISAVTILEPSGIEFKTFQESSAPDNMQLTLSFHRSNKINYWKYALRMTKEHPLVGVGAGNFNIVLPQYYQKDAQADPWFKNFITYDPHNTYLGILAECGILGLCAFITLLFFLTGKLLQGLRILPDGSRKKLFCFTALAALAGLFIESLAMDAQNLRHVWVMLAVVCGMLDPINQKTHLT